MGFKNKKQNNSLNFIIPLKVYPFDVYVSIGESNEKLRKDLQKYIIEDDEIERAMFNHISVQGRCCLFDTNQSLIRLRRFPVTPFDFGVLSHEVFHVVTYIMNRVGMKLSLGKSDEAYSYLVGYITEKIHEKITKG